MIVWDKFPPSRHSVYTQVQTVTWESSLHHARTRIADSNAQTFNTSAAGVFFPIFLSCEATIDGGPIFTL